MLRSRADHADNLPKNSRPTTITAHQPMLDSVWILHHKMLQCCQTVYWYRTEHPALIKVKSSEAIGWHMKYLCKVCLHMNCAHHIRQLGTQLGWPETILPVTPTSGLCSSVSVLPGRHPREQQWTSWPASHSAKLNRSNTTRFIHITSRTGQTLEKTVDKFGGR